MSGFDLILEKNPTKSQLKSALSKSFDIKEENIYLSEDIEDFPSSDDNELWCVTYEKEGDFLLLCNFFIGEESQKNPPNIITKKICHMLDSKALIDDGRINPYTWLMVLPDGSEKLIKLDPDEMNNERYFIVK
ncbi:hypothetical protein I2492_14165 [Budviciaceae bacterium CWB-B4]|uniref:Uncharacterized protein n=1 Tax=Limnobaculum xujianqingii TaxID=2738837 RepID=A0A9D7AK49_9GAMM|nr:hypothetical protein [Limnobaculum xujianqingii]MBK5074154.1 hypothetical protein [Limnobaculum xujianqingii]MBK5177463.1 hypothetical protein [Limnobaculum xujianqingii]